MGNLKNITVIPARARIGNTVKADDTPKLRVAAYCRVSTDSEEQATSYEAQVEHYTNYIKGNPEWELAGIYADVYNQKLIPFDTKMAAKMIKITAFEGKNACPKPLFLFFEIV